MTIELNKDGLEAATKATLNQAEYSYSEKDREVFFKQRKPYYTDIAQEAVKAYLPYHDKQQVERIMELEMMLKVLASDYIKWGGFNPVILTKSREILNKSKE